MVTKGQTRGRTRRAVREFKVVRGWPKAWLARWGPEPPTAWHSCGEDKACQEVWASGRLMEGGGREREAGSPQGEGAGSPRGAGLPFR